MKPRATFEKRRKEQARKERQQEKADRRAVRKLNRENGVELPDGGSPELELNQEVSAAMQGEAANTNRGDDPEPVSRVAVGMTLH